MLQNTQKLVIQFTFIGLCMFPAMLPALIMVHEGNDPVPNMGWPTGTEEVANLPSRIGYKEGPPFGGGEYFFEYHCENMAGFNNALQKFSAIHVPRLTTQSLVSLNGQRTKTINHKPLLLAVHDHVKDSSTEESRPEGAGEKKRVDWTFTIWVPENYYRLFNHPKNHLMVSDHPNFRQPVPQPRIDVYVGGDSPIIWKEVQVPSNIQVIDKRAESSPINLEKGGAIRGSVFDMATHQIIANADIVLAKQNEQRQVVESLRTQTDEKGNFEIRNIPHGYYRVHIYANGYAVRDMGPYNNLKRFTYDEFEALLSKTASCKGIVKDEKGNALFGVEVTAREMIGIDGLGYKCPTYPTATTDEQGRFVLTSLPNGFTHIRCRAPSLHQETSILNLYKISSQPLEKPEDIEIVVSGTGLVRGKVIGSDGKPPKRAFIVEIEPKGGNTIGSWGGSMQCKEDGSFEFKGVPLGEYIVIAKPNPMKEGEASSPKPVTITAGKTVEVEIVSD